MSPRWSDEELDEFHKEFTTKVEEGAVFMREMKDDIASIKESLELWEEARTVIQAGTILGKLAKWLTSLAFVGVMFAWLLERYSGAP